MQNQFKFDSTLTTWHALQNWANTSAITLWAVIGVLFFGFGGTAGAKEITKQLDALAPLMGDTWIYEGVDDEGNSVVDRQNYRWALDRQFITIEQANRGQDKEFITETTVGWDDDTDQLVFWNFTNSGRVNRGVITVNENSWLWEARSPELETVRWRALIEMLDENQTRHTIRIRNEDGTWVDLHTRTYRRVTVQKPLKTSLAIHLEATVDARPEDVFPLWLSEAGINQFFAPAANIEPWVGGRYEMIFSPDVDPEGSSLGTQGAEILELVENEVLAFEWPSFLAWESPNGGGPPVSPTLRGKRPISTWVRIQFDPLQGHPNRTRVRLSHYGFENGGVWLESRRYFWTAWPSVLGRLGGLFVNDELGFAAIDE